MIVIFTEPSNNRCNRLKNLLNAGGYEYREVDLSDAGNEDVETMLKAGIEPLGAPIIKIGCCYVQYKSIFTPDGELSGVVKALLGDGDA